MNDKKRDIIFQLIRATRKQTNKFAFVVALAICFIGCNQYYEYKENKQIIKSIEHLDSLICNIDTNLVKAIKVQSLHFGVCGFELREGVAPEEVLSYLGKWESNNSN